jgi:light-regulated signal transduction histidine kinase (bacteriophytochrome)
VTGDALRIMRVESGEITATAIDGNHDANAIAFSPDGHELAFGCGKQLLIHEVVSGRQQRFAATDDEVFAVKYSPERRSIWVSVRRNGQAVRIEVRDEGPGLTDTDKTRLFGRFQRLSARPTGGETSTGLGLSIVKHLVELHGGTVRAENGPEHGARFTITIAAA